MSIVAQILNEDPVGFAGLARRIRSRRRDGQITPQACWRWAVRGIKLPDGRVVKLEAVLCAGRYLTSYAAYERFVAAQNPPAEATPLPAPVRSIGKRERASRRAAEMLDAAGV